MARALAPIMSGSSPLARGPRRGHSVRARRVGLIPARAGTTCWCVGWLSEGGAHPRSRGDHHELVTVNNTCRGSSPLARGPHVLFIAVPLWVGLIPARAGTTALCCAQGPDYRAHPRSRGDHVTYPAACAFPGGSSPLARGPLGTVTPTDPTSGLIPARAGTTLKAISRRNPTRAHPRSRGDHSPALKIASLPAGSSPLARGPRIKPIFMRWRRGLIPARAGTTEAWFAVDSDERAHPRSRGDHARSCFCTARTLGSSPLARGPPPRDYPVRWVLGLIPARAGTTLADMGFYPLHQQNRITLKPEPKSRIHDKQLLLTTTSTAILTRLTPP